MGYPLQVTESQVEPSSRLERTHALLIRGREGVRTVLEPHLGPVYALERANNIAQALVFQDVEPRGVVFEMLRHIPCELLRTRLADLVTRAWLDSAN